MIIVNWNTRDLLRDCLESVRDHAGQVTVEVVVVDNGSTDETAAMVAGEFPQVRLICNADNRGFAAANNQGIAVARARHILLLNSDTRIVGGAIARAVSFLDEHPDVAVVGCNTLYPDGRPHPLPNCYMFPSLLNLALSLSRLSQIFPRSRFFGRGRMTWWRGDGPIAVDVVAGCFMLVRRIAIDQVGPLSEKYFMYSEDTDWCWRFAQQGWKVMYLPDIAIVHLLGASSSQCAADMHVMQRKSLLMFMEMRSGRLARWLANGMFLISSLFRLPMLVLLRLRGGAGAQSATRQWNLTMAAVKYHLLGRVPVTP